jgi:hypothetical protein
MGFDFHQTAWCYIPEDRLVFENRSLGRIFGCKREEVIRWTKLHNEELHNLFSSLLNIIWVIKSRIMRWAGGVVCMAR